MIHKNDPPISAPTCISTQHDEVDKRPRASNPSPDIAYYLTREETGIYLFLFFLFPCDRVLSFFVMPLFKLRNTACLLLKINTSCSFRLNFVFDWVGGGGC